uniref:cytoplasmic dynein 1 light intermediate chain 2-like isoform X1 n=1 Tax=Myxine glutinosa TaxID=7769 RepID=UPI00358E1848
MEPVEDTPCFGRAEAEEPLNLWLSILGEVSTRSSSKLPGDRNVLLLGEDGSGKTALVARLNGTTAAHKGRGIEYRYLNVHDEDRDERTCCSVWVMDGDPFHHNLLRFALTSGNMHSSLVLLVADLARPWQIPEALNRWSAVLRDYIHTLNLSSEEMKDMENKLIKEYQSYIEPGRDASPRGGPGSQDVELDEVELTPLDDGTLTCNLGVPIVVVCTKSDALSMLEKEYDYREEHFDFIQFHIRTFCLRYGAALVYTSIKEDRNVQLLYKYLVHRLYGFPFETPAQVVEKDSIFIPAGWDNKKKMAILHESLQSVKSDDRYEEVILQPSIRKLVQEKELTSEDEQTFLSRQQMVISKQPSAAHLGDTPGTPLRMTGRSGPMNVASVSPLPIGSKKLDSSNIIKGSPSNEGVLANFFNSLLTKKAAGSPGCSPSPGSSPNVMNKGSKATMSEYQAELDRMVRRGDTPVTNSPMPTDRPEE